jgi:hypothetical protein
MIKSPLSCLTRHFFVSLPIQKDKQCKGQKDKQCKGQKDKQYKGQKDKQYKGQKNKRTKRQTVIYKTLLRLKTTEQHELHKNRK